MANKEQIKFDIVRPKNIYVPQFAEINRSGGEYVYYGNDNRFPQYLWGLYLKSPILSSIINGTADFVYGDGIEWNENLAIKSDYINQDGDTLEDIVKKITIDNLIFGGFALKINRNANMQISDIQWLDFQNIRINDEETCVTYWAKGFKYFEKKEKYPVYDDLNPYMTSVFYFKGHITRAHYPVPRYVGALAAIETSTEISKFHLNTIHNNFSANFIVNYNNVDYTEEQKKEIINGIRENFTSAENAGRFMVAFNNGKENAVTVARIPEDNFDKKYDALKDSTMKDIFVSFRAQPQLFGFTIEGSLFNKEEYSEAFSLYNRTCVKPLQADIERCFSKIFDTENVIKIKPFTVGE